MSISNKGSNILVLVCLIVLVQTVALKGMHKGLSASPGVMRNRVGVTARSYSSVRQLLIYFWGKTQF